MEEYKRKKVSELQAILSSIDPQAKKSGTKKDLIVRIMEATQNGEVSVQDTVDELTAQGGKPKENLDLDKVKVAAQNGNPGDIVEVANGEVPVQDAELRENLDEDKVTKDANITGDVKNKTKVDKKPDSETRKPTDIVVNNNGDVKDPENSSQSDIKPPKSKKRHRKRVIKDSETHTDLKPPNSKKCCTKQETSQDSPVVVTESNNGVKDTKNLYHSDPKPPKIQSPRKQPAPKASPLAVTFDNSSKVPVQSHPGEEETSTSEIKVDKINIDVKSSGPLNGSKLNKKQQFKTVGDEKSGEEKNASVKNKNLEKIKKKSEKKKKIKISKLSKKKSAEEDEDQIKIIETKKPKKIIAVKAEDQSEDEGEAEDHLSNRKRKSPFGRYNYLTASDEDVMINITEDKESFVSRSGPYISGQILPNVQVPKSYCEKIFGPKTNLANNEMAHFLKMNPDRAFNKQKGQNSAPGTRAIQEMDPSWISDGKNSTKKEGRPRYSSDKNQFFSVKNGDAFSYAFPDQVHVIMASATNRLYNTVKSEISETAANSLLQKMGKAAALAIANLPDGVERAILTGTLAVIGMQNIDIGKEDSSDSDDNAEATEEKEELGEEEEDSQNEGEDDDDEFDDEKEDPE